MRRPRDDSRGGPHPRVLGIDPGTVTTGYGIIEDSAGRLHCVASGGISAPPRAPLPDRLKTIFHELIRLIGQYHPTAMAVEDMFFAKNVKAAIALGQARGIALLAAAQTELPIFEYTPTQVKLAVTGYGGADKDQVGAMVARLLGLTHPPAPRRSDVQHAADALASAICHLHSHKLQALVAGRP